MRPNKILECYGDEKLKDFAEYDIIISDSSTCTAEKNPGGKDKYWNDKTGSEFKQLLEERNFQGKYIPLWGRGLKELYNQIWEEWENKKELKMENVLIICAGNDIQWGLKWTNQVFKPFVNLNVACLLYTSPSPRD